MGGPARSGRATPSGSWRPTARSPCPPTSARGSRPSGDRARYQTVYAEVPGSVAAPTAGLHFTPEVFDRLDRRGVGRVDVTLHVGIGTFRPIEADRIEDHVLHAERAELTPEAAETLNRRKAEGGRVVAVGTTSARVLEASAASGRFEPFAGETALYLRPGHAFRGVDALLTNFHLPRSSLLVLVSALAGVDLIRDGLPRGGPPRIPLLQLWRRHADPLSRGRRPGRVGPPERVSPIRSSSRLYRVVMRRVRSLSEWDGPPRRRSRGPAPREAVGQARDRSRADLPKGVAGESGGPFRQPVRPTSRQPSDRSVPNGRRASVSPSGGTA